MQLTPAAAPLPAAARRLAGPLLVSTNLRRFLEVPELVFPTTARRLTAFCNGLDGFVRRRTEAVPAALRVPCSAAPVSARPKAGMSYDNAGAEQCTEKSYGLTGGCRHGAESMRDPFRMEHHVPSEQLQPSQLPLMCERHVPRMWAATWSCT